MNTLNKCKKHLKNESIKPLITLPPPNLQWPSVGPSARNNRGFPLLWPTQSQPLPLLPPPPSCLPLSRCHAVSLWSSVGKRHRSPALCVTDPLAPRLHCSNRQSFNVFSKKNVMNIGKDLTWGENITVAKSEFKMK